MLSLAVILGVVAAWRAWQSGRGWTWFWTITALGTLVKGPLVVALSAAGLLASLSKGPPGTSPKFRGTHRAGVAICLTVAGGWFIGAYLQGGPPIIEKMLHRELVGHAIGTGAERWQGLHGAYAPAWTLLQDYAPWSLLTVASAWRALTRPAEDPVECRFERFVLVWLAVDLLIFSLAAHHRARLIYPVVPAAALLAGRELGRWTWPLSARTLLRVSAALEVRPARRLDTLRLAARSHW
jgi:4-amino-4-deoxy-L-arabinose transferase-like glycosyltransferase